MYDGTSRSDPDALSPMAPVAQSPEDAAHIELRFAQRAGQSRLVDLKQKAPLRALFPHVTPGEPPTAYVTNTAGGLVGGDRQRIRIAVEPDAELMVMAQAAEKVYRTARPDLDVRVDIQLQAAEGAWLEWLPQETILFDQCRLRRATQLDLAANARVLAGEITVFGRAAHGEQLRTALFHDHWRVRSDGRAVWADRLGIDGDMAAALAAPAGFAGAGASALIIVHPGDGSAETLRDRMREIEDEGGADGLGSNDSLRIGATVIGSVLIVRFLARDPAVLRAAFARRWCVLRQSMGGYGAVLPRLWHV